MNRVKQIIRRYPGLILLLGAYFALAVGYGAANPIHEATDEIRHYRFVRYLVDHLALPVQGEGPSIQAHHPPLYYASAALLTWWARPANPYGDPPENPFWAFNVNSPRPDNKNLYIHGPDERFPWRGDALAAHAARIVTALWGTAAVLGTWLLAREFWPRAALGAAGLIAFTPQFLYLSGAVNNDVPGAAAGAFVLWLSVRMIRLGFDDGRALGLGIAYAAALLVKSNLVALGGVIGLAFALRVIRSRDVRGMLRAALIVIGAAGALAGWWYVRNVQLYGDLMGFGKVTQLWGVRDPSESFDLAIMELPYAWSSLWGRFGYGQLPMPAPIYSLMALVIWPGVALFALSIAIRAILPPRHEGCEGLAALVIIAQAAGMFLVLFGYILVSPAGAMGRFFFPGLPALAVMVAAGFERLSSLPALLRGKGPGLGGIGAALALMMLALGVYGLFGVLIPAYVDPAHLSEDVAIPNSIDAQLGGSARVLGYEIYPGPITPGEAWDLTVYWEVLARTDAPHSVFVHLVGAYDLVVAQRDTYPGLGAFPSHHWKPGRRFAETYRIEIPRTASTPDQVQIMIGLAGPDARLPVTGEHASDSGDAVLLPEIVPVPERVAEGVPNPQHVNFGDHMLLVGFREEDRVTGPGGGVWITLYWQMMQPTDWGWRVFLHALDESGEIRGSADGHTRDGEAFLTPDTWEVGEIVPDRRFVPLPEEPGRYRLEVGWFNPEIDSNTRWPIIAEDGHWEPPRLLLPEVRVAESEAAAEAWRAGR